MSLPVDMDRNIARKDIIAGQQINTNPSMTPSPRTKTRHLLRHWRNAPRLDSVKKTLKFNYSVVEDFKDKYRTSSYSNKNAAALLVFRKLVNKYKCMRLCEKTFRIGSVFIF